MYLQSTSCWQQTIKKWARGVGGVGGQWSLTVNINSVLLRNIVLILPCFISTAEALCVCVCVCRTQLQGGMLLISLQCPLLKCFRPHVMPTRDEEGVLCIAGRVFLRHEKGVKIPETALNEIVCRHLREPANQNAHDSHFHYFFLLIRDINKPQLNFNETSACFNSKWWIIQRHALVELNHSTFLDVTNHKIRQPDYISDWYKIYHTHIILNIKNKI